MAFTTKNPRVQSILVLALFVTCFPSDITAMTTSTADSLSPILVTGLYRYAVKGLSGDALDRVDLYEPGETFPDDRRYALLYESKQHKFNGQDWLHKENFLCAFTDPALMASLQSKYQIIATTTTTRPPTTKRLLEIKHRATQELLLPPTDLTTTGGRQQLGNLLSNLSGRGVVCVTADDDDDDDDDTPNNNNKHVPHKFQFGNTSSGYKQNKGDTRTLHIINQNTVKAVSEAIGIPLDPRRFRPNLVIDGPAPFDEFDWVERQQSLLSSGEGSLRALSRTVRCRGISLDPLDAVHGQKELDLPALLTKHFPQHGPYLGIYACLEKAPFSIQVGDELTLSSSILTQKGAQ